MSAFEQPPIHQMVFRKTNAYAGRHVSVTPKNSTNVHLSYGRIILNASVPSVAFANENQETGLICLSGDAHVAVGDELCKLSQYDSIYIPRGSQMTVTTTSAVDFAEFSADVEGHYPLQFVPYCEVEKNASLKFQTGGPASARMIHILLGKNVNAGRLLVGFTTSESGNWTSWPPHEHEKMLEEMYVYFNMPEPAFGIQCVYKDTKYPELITAVRDGDAVLMPGGYHPNMAVPGHSMVFLWAMAAHREQVDRQFGVVNVQPEFAAHGSGLEASHK